MPRPPTGTVERHGDHWDAKLSLGDGSRPRVCLSAVRFPTKELARAESCRLTREARTKGLTRAVPSSAVPAGETVRAWSERWLDARTARGLRSVRDDRGRLSTHVLPVLGERAMASLTRADLEDLVATLDTKVRGNTLGWKTAQNVWALVTAMMRDASTGKNRALRVRLDNPAVTVPGPDRGVRKVKAYLYPGELLAVLEESRTLLHWRRIFALAVYTYVRVGELEALEWSDVDLAHGTIHVHRATDALTGEVRETKGRASRRIPIEPNLRPLLEAMRREAGGTGLVVPHMPSRELGAPMLRDALGRAGVKRAELFANDPTRKHITVHDLRATGVTWAIVRGDEPARVQHRAGHTTYATTEGYVREAEAAAADFGEVFPPLPRGLLGERGIVQESSEPTTPEANMSESLAKNGVPCGIRIRARRRASGRIRTIPRRCVVRVTARHRARAGVSRPSVALRWHRPTRARC